MILLELTATQCRISVPTDCDLEQVSEWTSALEAYGYASEFRLVHYYLPNDVIDFVVV